MLAGLDERKADLVTLRLKTKALSVIDWFCLHTIDFERLIVVSVRLLAT